MEISGTIFEVVVEPSYKTTRTYANRYGHRRKMRGVSESQKTYSKMGNRTEKCRKSYVYSMRDRSKITYMIHVNIHTSEQCKDLNGFGTSMSQEVF